jgi:2-hydroxy-6-oxonona-2,4-dienedioate hydrolase
MASQAVAVTANDERTSKYRDAEAALWDHYGLAPTERHVELRSPRAMLRVLEVGNGRPVLFVPGTPGTGPYWGGLVRQLPGIRSLLLDRPGWGLSDPIDYRGRDYGHLVADVLEGVLDALGLDEVDVVGNSIGDAWALRLAQLKPSRVGRVVLIGSGPLLPEVAAPPFIKLLASPIGALIVRLPMSANRVRALARDSGHGASLDAGRIPDVYVDWRVTFHRNTDSMRHERAMVRTLVGPRGWRPGLTFSDSELAAVRAPVLWLCGTEDPIGSLDLWRQAVGRMPDAELRVIDGAGHVPWLDDAEAVGGAIAAFLKR